MPRNVGIKDEYQRFIKKYSDKTSEIRFRFTKSHPNFLYFFNNFGDKKGEHLSMCSPLSVTDTNGTILLDIFQKTIYKNIKNF